MDQLSHELIGNIVAMHPHTAKVFKANRMDFCCGGNVTLEQICIQKKLPLQEIESELQEIIINKVLPQEDYQNWETHRLIDHIITVFHANVKSDSEELLPHLNKVVRVHGKKHPHLIAIQSLFLNLLDDLQQHIQKEEESLFPKIRAYQATDTEQQAEIEAEIRDLHSDHDDAGRILEQIASLSNYYTAPEEACKTYRLVYQLLELFQDALHLHVHLENNILFQRVKK